ncbi:uncharacterized protein NMK_0531 [Novimethylophilus kurashikiensis]|uniref:Uncharacterized protein n=1 Tax=Novimethylophilus kurashikiensis TaxID=1825523 RepID=A0A2R5F7W1_9PROT|nr:uncharacterized protein NMK_0531 [Novimethylophilus kurashikiensis]
MKVFLGQRKQKSSSHLEDGQLPVVCDLSLPQPPHFKGFSYTPEEGIEMSKRGSYSDMPGLEPRQK